MKMVATVIGTFVLAILAGLFKAFVILKIFDLYQIKPGLSFFQVYGFLLVLNLVIHTNYEEEKDTAKLIGKTIGTGFVGPLILWFMAWVISLVIVN